MKEEEIIKQIKKDRNLRIGLTTERFYWFFVVYFTPYLKYPLASFQKEILNLVQDSGNELLVVVAFRGSAKSTIVTLAFVIWCVVTGRKRYPLILSLNQQRVQQALFNIRQEFEKNALLLQDFGPFYKMDDEWSYSSLFFSHLEARITAISTGEGFRGLRERQFRPDVVISDDIEDVQSANSSDARAKLWQLLNAELLPIGDVGTKFIFLGNLVHGESALMRLKKLILEKKLKGIYREFPLYDDNKNILWKEKFENWEDIENLRKQIPNDEDFQREYLIKPVPPGNRVIKKEWICYYDPSQIIERDDFRYYLVSVDPAVTLSSSADNTAIIVFAVYGWHEKLKIYVQPNPINKKMEMPEIIEEIKNIKASLGKSVVEIIVEGVAAQKGIAQTLVAQGIEAKEFNLNGQDKRARLSMCSPLIKNATVLFANKGNEELIQQTLYFGSERFDDLVDALSMGLNSLTEELTKSPFMYAFV
ncbi:phage terminase large subunit [Candidatus Daviesbacteria bacterium]|nr:phage terminase large subunit [Candidatus Daviesbacteria bacterium]